MESYEINRKEQVFKTWDELILILELTALMYSDSEIIKELLKIQSEKKLKSEQLYSRESSNDALKKINLKIDGHILKSLIIKWEELEIDAYLYLQEARARGGTLGHKIGPIWSFQKKEKEKYEGILLQLTKIELN